jgi:hypothetical protein
MSVSSRLMVIIAVKIELHARSKKISMSLREVGTLVLIMPLDIEQNSPPTGQIVGLPFEAPAENALPVRTESEAPY